MLLGPTVSIRQLCEKRLIVSQTGGTTFRLPDGSGRGASLRGLPRLLPVFLFDEGLI